MSLLKYFLDIDVYIKKYKKKKSKKILDEKIYKVSKLLINEGNERLIHFKAKLKEGEKKYSEKHEPLITVILPGWPIGRERNERIGGIETTEEKIEVFIKNNLIDFTSDNEINQFSKVVFIFSPQEVLEKISFVIDKTFQKRDNHEYKEAFSLFLAIATFSKDGVIIEAKIEQNADGPYQEDNKEYFLSRPSTKKLKSNFYRRNSL